MQEKPESCTAKTFKAQNKTKMPLPLLSPAPRHEEILLNEKKKKKKKNSDVSKNFVFSNIHIESPFEEIQSQKF